MQPVLPIKYNSSPESSTNPLPRPAATTQHGPLHLQPSRASCELAPSARHHDARTQCDTESASTIASQLAGVSLGRLSLIDSSDVKSCASDSVEQCLIGTADSIAANMDDEGLPQLTPDRSAVSTSEPTASHDVILYSPAQLTDLANETLICILSYLVDSPASIALVSKRFYALLTLPDAWRMAFHRQFPGHHAWRSGWQSHDASGRAVGDNMALNYRYFARLTQLGSWRGEYRERIRLLQSLAHRKSGPARSRLVGASRRPKTMTHCILTYDSRLPWSVSHLHADFTPSVNAYPLALHGAATHGMATYGGLITGKVHPWGLRNPFDTDQVEATNSFELHGFGDGPAASLNVMDLSVHYGMAYGQGFPGGRVYWRGSNNLIGNFLEYEAAGADTSNSDIPRIPHPTESITALWIAKSYNVTSLSRGMIGLISGSSLGVVTSYALGQPFPAGQMTARWVVSPGVPIIAIKVDDTFSAKRRSLKQVWAVALNALGEVYYLVDVPQCPARHADREKRVHNPWTCGRSVSWKLIESTRRQLKSDPSAGTTASHGVFVSSPRSHRTAMSRAELAAEARAIEQFLTRRPAYFRENFEGWDMRRRLEVDFARVDTDGSGQSLVVVDCGSFVPGNPHKICRWMRKRRSINHCGDFLMARLTLLAAWTEDYTDAGSPGLASVPAPSTLNDGLDPSPKILGTEDPLFEWQQTEFTGVFPSSALITATALDNTTHALTTWFEDPLQAPCLTTPFGRSTSVQPLGLAADEIPGKCSRFFAVGTSHGLVVVWNMRERAVAGELSPVRVIYTGPAAISSLAIAALYLVHGGCDGLAQAWDPLASSREPIQTLHPRSPTHDPRHITTANTMMPPMAYFGVNAIFLDPDPTALRGVLACGSLVRCWAFGSVSSSERRRKGSCGSDPLSCRLSDSIQRSISEQTVEMTLDEEARERHQLKLRYRFGVGMSDMTDEEALQYAELLSKEAFELEQQQQRSESSDAIIPTSEMSETVSSMEFTSTKMPPPPEAGSSLIQVSSLSPKPCEEIYGNFEFQIQQAIRLSLLDAGTGSDLSFPGDNADSCDFSIKFKEKKKGKRPSAKKAPGPRPGLGSAYASTSGSSSLDLATLDEDEALSWALAQSLEMR